MPGLPPAAKTNKRLFLRQMRQTHRFRDALLSLQKAENKAEMLFYKIGLYFQ